MRFLVTGATGFIGSHMVEAILKRGWEVVCPVRDPSRLRNLEGMPAQICTLGEIADLVRRVNPFDYVIHLGGATRAEDYAHYTRANVDWTMELLELCVDPRCRRAPARFVLVSSQAAAGPCTEGTRPVVESDAPRPVSLYGKSKLEAEHKAARYMDRLPITIVRPPTVFGPRDRDVLNVFLWAKRGLVTYIAGPDRLVSIVYVQDLVEGILAAAMSERSVGETYFLANPFPVVWREFSMQVAEALGKNPWTIPVPVPVLRVAALGGDLVKRLTGATPLMRSEKLDEMRQLAWVCAAEKASRDLGWEATTPLREAIDKTSRWYLEQGWI
ncbi:MAG: NAD(P)-dependent oxidoreductase [Thermodesulfobacteriota bacterium]